MMTRFYRYILGVDLGIASIGIALILLDKENMPIKILDMGARIFSIPEGAAERRQKRLERKHLRSKKQRIAKLARILQEYGLLPKGAAERELLKIKNPYQLRAAAVSGKVALEDLARCLLHIIKFRGAGFLTQQEEAAEDEAIDNEGPSKPKDKQKSASAYRFLESFLKNKKVSLSQYFVERLESKDPVRRRKRFIEQNRVEYAVPRFLVKDEFRRIWAMQQKFHQNLSSDLEEIIYTAIFSDAPHAPYATGNCSLVLGETRLPRMHRLAEQRRIYEQINNIRYLTPEGELFLHRPLRDLLVERAYKHGQKLTKSELRKIISEFTGHKVVQVNLGDEDAHIKGFCHVAAFADISAWQSMSEQEQDAVIDFIADPLISPDDPRIKNKVKDGQTLQLLYPEDEFLEKLCEMLHLDAPDSEEKASVAVSRLAQGRSNLGLTASTRILEKLISGYEEDIPTADGQTTKLWRPHTYRTASDACGFTAEEERIRALQGTYDFLPYYGEILQHDVTPIHPWHKNRATQHESEFGRIPNPVVHVALNQLRKVVNETIKLYGKPQSIHVEFARELGLSAAKREQLIKDILKNEQENERINQALIELHLTPSRRNRIKYRLWEEQGKRSLFSLKEIKASDIAACEIEHLIPRAKGGTDTMMNLCLVFDDENKAKGESFPYDAIKRIAPEKFTEISKVINDKKYPKAKAWRFSADAEKRYELLGDADQTDRRLSDTSYIAKMGARYLKAICPDVVAVKGGTTGYLRHLWGLDGLEYELLGLPVSEHLFDKATGEVLLDPHTGHPASNPLWRAKPRIDHRHHALDALVAACTSRHMVSRLVQAEKQGKRLAEFPVPFGDCTADFRYQAKRALERILPSPKQEHATSGQLHDATKYRILRKKGAKAAANSYLIRYNRSLDNIKGKKDVQNILFNTNTIPLDSPEVQSAFSKCQHIISTIENYYIKAEAALTEASGTQAKETNTVRKAIELAQVTGALGHNYPCLDHKRLVAVNTELKFGYEPKSNYCMDFYETTDGKVGWECITRIDAASNSFIPKWKQQGCKRIWSLHIGDVIEVAPGSELRKDLGELCPAKQVYLVVQKMSEGKLQCNLLHDARPKDGNNPALAPTPEAKVIYKRWSTGEKGLGFYCELAARSIELSPLGKISRKHKRLWSGKKVAQKT